MARVHARRFVKLTNQADTSEDQKKQNQEVGPTQVLNIPLKAEKDVVKGWMV